MKIATPKKLQTQQQIAMKSAAEKPDCAMADVEEHKSDPAALQKFAAQDPWEVQI